MMYFYKIKIKFKNGKESFTKDYIVDFLHVAQLFEHLENKHKDNYTLISIKERKKF